MDFVTRVAEHLELREDEGACSICHDILAAVNQQGGEVSAFENPLGVEAIIRDDRGHVVGNGLDIAAIPAVLAAEVDAGLVPDDLSARLRREGLSSEHDIAAQAALFGFGLIHAPSAIALEYVRGIGGHTMINREGLGVRAEMVAADGRILSWSPTSFCPTCAIAKAVVRNKEMKEHVAEHLVGTINTGRKKWRRRLENRFVVKGGATMVSILENDRYLAKDAEGSSIYQGIAKAEVMAGLTANELRFNIGCDDCPMKQEWTKRRIDFTEGMAIRSKDELKRIA